MSRPSIRRALRRAGLSPTPRPPRAPGPRNRDVPPPPRIFLAGETGEAGPLDLSALFGRTAPLELEVGTGKARFLLEEAATHRERDYLGIELQAEYARIVRSKAEKLGLTNVRIEPLDGKAFVIRRLAAESLDRLHVYFPDPWPKKRHQKRRLVDPEFAAAAARALVPGGELRAASDHADYWAAIAAALDAEPLLERLPEAETADWWPGTDYELKFRKSGRPIGKGIWRRRER